MLDLFGMILGVLFLYFIPFIPFIIACFRKHKNTIPIFCVNLFLGWTLIGWVGSLVWSLINLDKKN